VRSVRSPLQGYFRRRRLSLYPLRGKKGLIGILLPRNVCAGCGTLSPTPMSATHLQCHCELPSAVALRQWLISTLVGMCSPQEVVREKMVPPAEEEAPQVRRSSRLLGSSTSAPSTNPMHAAVVSGRVVTCAVISKGLVLPVDSPPVVTDDLRVTLNNFRVSAVVCSGIPASAMGLLSRAVHPGEGCYLMEVAAVAAAAYPKAFATTISLYLEGVEQAYHTLVQRWTQAVAALHGSASSTNSDLVGLQEAVIGLTDFFEPDNAVSRSQGINDSLSKEAFEALIPWVQGSSSITPSLLAQYTVQVGVASEAIIEV